jgi:formyltetrahydrofolate synthetase
MHTIEKIGVLPGEYDLYGNIKCKISLGVRDRLKNQMDGYYIVTTGINPTPLGEGKSTTTIGMLHISLYPARLFGHSC